MLAAHPLTSFVSVMKDIYMHILRFYMSCNIYTSNAKTMSETDETAATLVQRPHSTPLNLFCILPFVSSTLSMYSVHMRNMHLNRLKALLTVSVSLSHLRTYWVFWHWTPYRSRIELCFSVIFSRPLHAIPQPLSLIILDLHVWWKAPQSR